MQANFGRRDGFTVLGVAVGKAMPLDRPCRTTDKETGSIIVIPATDSPLSDALLRGLVKRAGLGIGRSGAVGGNSSGDIFLAFSTADPMADPASLGPVITRQSLNREAMDPVCEAAVQAVDEAVINAIVQGEDAACVKPEGRVCPGIDTAALFRIVQAHLASGPLSGTGITG